MRHPWSPPHFSHGQRNHCSGSPLLCSSISLFISTITGLLAFASHAHPQKPRRGGSFRDGGGGGKGALLRGEPGGRCIQRLENAFPFLYSRIPAQTYTVRRRVRVIYITVKTQSSGNPKRRDSAPGIEEAFSAGGAARVANAWYRPEW